MFAQYSREGTLGASASNSTSHSLTEAIDLDIVDQIVARARDATSFPEINDVYSVVLPANGIHPQHDSLYYQFLIKLGMVNAVTWGERWDIWRAAREREAESARADRPQHVKHGANPMRARVPFLASASSDLDEGYADESDADTATSEVVAIRQSPRKVMMGETRSMVGFTPTPSDAEESQTFSPSRPIRTSTPVQSQRRGYYAVRAQAITATPPTYSESEADLTITSPILRAYPSHVRQSMLVGRETDPAVLREMELRADQFHRLGLIGRCWGQWRQSSEWLCRTTAQIDTVRDTLVLQQTLGKWRAMCEYRLSQPGTADAHYEHKRKQEIIDHWLARLRNKRLERLEEQVFIDRAVRAVRVAFKTWRGQLVKLRTKRWEADMHTREIGVTKKFDQNRVRRAFHIWHDASRERMADKHRVTTTLKGAFHIWRNKAAKSWQLSQSLQTWQQRTDATLIVRTFDLWNKHATLRPLERKLVNMEEQRVVARAWGKWQLSARQQAIADVFNKARVLKNAMSRIKASSLKAQTREQKAIDYADNRDLALMRKSMKVWLAEERGKLLLRVLETRKARSFFSKWQARKDRVLAADSTAEQFIVAANTRRLHNSLSRWRDVLGQKRNATLKADLIFEARTKHALFTKWHTASSKLSEDIITADKAHAFFTLRVSFKVWRIALAHKRQNEFIEKRKITELRTAFSEWRLALAQSIHDRQQVDLFRASQDRQLMKRTLSLWTEKVVEIKARELDTAEQRDKVLVADAFARWQRAHKRKTDLVALMQSFVDVKREETIQRAFVTWAVRARKASDLKLRLDQFQRDRDEHLLAETFASWHDQKRERDLRAIEAEVALRHEDALLFSVLDKWIARGRLLRAVQFDKQRLARSVFPIWKTALKRQQKMKAIAAEQNLRLMGDSFALWKAAYKSKLAKRPVHRSRRRLAQADSLDSLHGSPSAKPAAASIRTRHSFGGIVDNTTVTPARSRHRPMAVGRGGSASPDPGRDRERDRSAAVSVASEPAYSRLRSELLGRGTAGVRPRVVSDESPAPDSSGGPGRGVSGTPGRSRTMAELVQALRAAK